MTIPLSLQSVLWSSNIGHLDIEKDKNLYHSPNLGVWGYGRYQMAIGGLSKKYYKIYQEIFTPPS